jgi:CRP-like cAMP-binding protein
MKRIGSSLGGPALRAALSDLEASREARTKGTPRDLPPSSGGSPNAGGVVRSLERVRAAQRLADASQLQTLARKAGLSSEAAAQLADGLRAQVPNGWTFIMLHASQNASVVRWINTHSSRPLAAGNLWAHLFEVIRNDTGEVMASRSDLADYLGVEPYHVSRIMSELASINAIRRERNGRGVRYFMNSNVATHLPGAAARKAARETDGPLLVSIQGGRSSLSD